MVTWNEAAPPVLAPPTFGGRVAGGLRLVAMILLTVVALAIFLPCRWLREKLMPGVTLHFRIAQVWSRLCLRLAGLRLAVKGRPIDSGALVANHASWLDILPLRATQLLYFVSKADVRNWKGIGFIADVTGTVFIERRRSEAKRQEAELRRRIAMGQVLCFFPEGTSTDGLRVLPFKSALFSAFMETTRELYVQPVTIRYLTNPRSGLPENFYGWWGTMPFGGHIWDVLTRSFGGRVEVIYHQPVHPGDFPDRKALAEHCQREVARGLHKGEI